MSGILARALSGRKASGRAAFIPYITAGDPSLAWTERFARALERAGADVLELGVPFSDPIADGPVNQRAAQRALRAKTTLPKILRLIGRLRRSGFSVPIVLFTYYNPLLAMGLAPFARAAAAAGVAGVLAVDVPPEEAGPLRSALAAAGLELVTLASPTTSDSRLGLIGRTASGFVYYVSRLGVTGASKRLSGSLKAELARVRRRVGKLVAVGFGISTPAQAGAAARGADGVIVGSALVALIERFPPARACAELERLAKAIVARL